MQPNLPQQNQHLPVYVTQQVQLTPPKQPNTQYKIVSQNVQPTSQQNLSNQNQQDYNYLKQENFNLKQQLNNNILEIQELKKQKQQNNQQQNQNNGEEMTEIQTKTLFLIEENQKLMDYVEELEKNMNTQQSPQKEYSNKETQQKFKELQDINNQLTQDVQSLQHLLQQSESKNAHILTEKLQVENQKNTLYNEKQRLLVELDKENQNLDTLQQEINEFKQQSMEQFNQKQRKYLDEKQKDSEKILFLEEKINQFINDNEKLNNLVKQRLDEIQNLRKTEQQQRDLIDQLQESLAKKDLISAQQLESQQNLEKQIKDLEKDKNIENKKNQIIIQLEKEVSKLAECLEQSQQQIATNKFQYQQELQKQEQKIEQIQQQLVESEKQAQQREEDILDQEKVKLKNIKTQCEEYMQQIKNQYEEHSQNQEDLNQKRYDEQQQNYKKQMNIMEDDYKSQIQDLEKELADLRTQNENNINKIEEIKEQYEIELEEKESKYNDLDEKYIKQQQIVDEKMIPVLEEKGEYQEKIASLESIIHKKDEQIRTHQDHNIQAENIKAKQEKIIASFEKREQEYRQQMLLVQDLQRQVQGDQITLSKLNNEAGRSRQVIDNLMEENSQLKKDLHTLRVKQNEDFINQQRDFDRQLYSQRRQQSIHENSLRKHSQYQQPHVMEHSKSNSFYSTGEMFYNVRCGNNVAVPPY